MDEFGIGALFYLVSAALLWLVRPKASLSNTSLETVTTKEKMITITLVTVIILLCTLPMALSPIWNGESPEHRNQYEVMAESILAGHLYLDYGEVDPRLLAMDNPYDFDLREGLGVNYRWDHAFYNGRYYMYFGVVPVFLLFLPFRLLTGAALTTYHATQIFTALFIVGLFKLFFLWGRKFFPALSWSVYLSLAAAFSLMSVWYMVDAPALYCTAIAGGLCTMIWSLYFFSQAVWGGKSAGRCVGYGMLGSLCGALAFGCRPPIALANILAVPMLIYYLRGKRFGIKLLGQIVLFALPYVVVAILLMGYNEVRFDNPLEFGQSYQLTCADQSHYTDDLAKVSWSKIGKGIAENFIAIKPFSQTFPYVNFNSVIINFPILLAAYGCLLSGGTRWAIKSHKLSSFMVVLVLLPMVITAVEVMMSPFLQERYRLDIYWLMGLMAFGAFGFYYQSIGEKFRQNSGFLLSGLAYFTMFSCFLLWCVPNDGNFTLLFPQYLAKIAAIFRLGF